MRILAIRGENLASLANRFEIDFESEPLSGAGLFAITGETGAGKSTILDALCLALYDKFPRVAALSFKEDISDSSGKTVSANDPRSILRRGAARGFAEADFVGRDGGRYRARWEVARARGRVTGNLQNRMRSLSRIDENGGVIAAVESGVELVGARIVELTDLTFEQFRRTVLLAQGDFDAFLRADSSERAELLEKITGAARYAEISKRVYQRAKDAENSVFVLKQRLADIGLLDEETRAALVAETRNIDQQRASHSLARNTALAELSRFEAIANAEARLAKASTERDAALVAAAALEAERERLALVERVEPLRPLSLERQRRLAALQEARSAHEKAQSAATVAESAEEAEKEVERLAAIVLEQAEDQFKQFDPIWSQAESLDSKIDVAQIESKKAQELAAAAKETLHGKEAAHSTLRQQLEAIQVNLQTARETLASVNEQRPLHLQWRMIEGWLDKRGEFATQIRLSDKRLKELAAEIARQDELIVALDADDASDKTERDRLAPMIEQKSTALAALDEAAALMRDRELERRAGLLGELSLLARSHAEATHSIKRATGELNAARAAEQKERETIAALRQRRAIDDARRDETERLGELADAAASTEALRLRANLLDGEPCPVCGALEHPHAQSSDDANAFVDNLRARRAELRASIASADKSLAEACERESAARAQIEDARRRIDDADALQERASLDYAQMRNDWPHDSSAPPAEIKDAEAALKGLAAEIGAERKAIASKLDEAKVMRADIDSLRERCDRCAKAMEGRSRQRENARRAHADATIENMRLATEAKGLRERLASIDGSLTPFLAICELTPSSLDRDCAGAKAKLERMGAEFNAAAQNVATLEADCAERALLAAETAAEAREAAKAKQGAQQLATERAQKFEELHRERATLLGGEATAAHRSRVNAHRREMQERLLTASAKRAASSVTLAATQERAAAAATAVELAGETHGAALAAYQSMLAFLDLDEAICLDLLAVTAAERDRASAKIEVAARAAELAQEAANRRQTDLDDALRAGRPSQTAEDLHSLVAQCEERLARLGERVGAIKQRIAADDESRARADALAAEIEAASHGHKLWAEINLAIGSASGDKFRRFAQGVTLDHLIALANRHLVGLSSRYRLERATSENADLALQIVDRDMADERRSTRSLSGGERFLASLALALALCSLEGRESFVDTLFIDEGFGTLDAATLDIAIDALEALQGQGRKVGLISHVESLHQRIAVQIRVERRGGGRSSVRIDAQAFGAPG
jgi:exonuclease SbcC